MRPRSARGLLFLPLFLLLAAAIFFADLKNGEDLLIQKKYGEAAAAIEAVLADLPVEDRARGTFLLGHARLLAGEHRAAITAFKAVQADYPEAAEVAGSRFLEAKALERTGDLSGAAQIYRGEVERLVGLSRKEEVAATYLGLAEKAISKTPPQHDRAVAFFDLALDLGLPAARAQSVRLSAAEALLAANKSGDAIPRLRALLAELSSRAGAEVDRAAKKPRAMLALGRALRISGDRAGSRSVFRDLRALEPNGERAADACYEIALSYRVPQPAPAELDRAVAALRQLQAEHPTHERAIVADYLIARCQAHCGRVAEALVSLRAFLRAHGDSILPEVATARAMVGDVLASQKELSAAIAAYGEYLRLHPAHGEWERVQRAIVDAEFGLAVAAQATGVEQFGKARELYEAFAARYPLDARNPDIMNRLGDMLLVEKKYDEARAAFARCVAKYPGKTASSRAQFEIGRIHEQKKFNFEAALAAYRAVQGQWAARAQNAIQRLTKKRLDLATERVFRSNEQPVFSITSRNIEKVRVRVYRLALEDYFRATHTTNDIDRLDIEIIAPDTTFESAVDKYVRHKETRRDVEIGFAAPGAYVIKVDDQELEATTMVLVSDLALISKSNRHEFFVFTQDTQKQAPRGGVRVVLSDGAKVLDEGVTGPDGVYRWKGEELQQRDRLVVFAVDASGSGASSLPLSGLGYSPGLTPKGYLYTDRPLYGPGQRVHLKGIVREVDAGLYQVPKTAGYRVHVTRPNGRPALGEDVTFTPFGTFATSVDLPADADLGTWSVCVSCPSRPECTFHGGFEVGHYERPRLSLSIEPVETVVFRGEAVQGRAIVRHFYGEPAVGKQVAVMIKLPDGAELRSSGITNAAGEVPFSFPTDDFGEEAMAMLRAEIGGENVTASVVVPVVTTELTTNISTVRPLYLTGEQFDAKITVADRSGRPLAREATVVLSRLEQAAKGGGLVEIEVGRIRTKTLADGTAVASLTADKGGEHRLRVEVMDRFGTLITGESRVGISGEDDQQKLRLFGDRDTYHAGETASVKVMNRAGERLALLTWQGDGILAYETRLLPAGESTLALPIATEHAPNFALAVAMIDDKQLHTAERDFLVERDLRLELTMPKTAEPGAEIEVRIVARDADGKPVAAELSLALVDEALLAIAGPGAPAISPFFHGDLRETVFRTASSCTWSYRGASRRMSDELLAEERRALREAENRPTSRPVEERGFGVAPDPAGSPVLRNSLGRTGGEAAELQTATGFVQQLERAKADFDKAKQPQLAGNESLFRFAQSLRFANDESIDLSGFDASEWGMATRPRSDFRETGAWFSTIVTDGDGVATHKITLPHSTTTWRLLGKGVTADTQVGEASTSLTAKKSLQVGIVGPPVLVEGDEAEVRLSAHNLTDEQIELALSWQARGAVVDSGETSQSLAEHAELERAFRVRAAELGDLDLLLTGSAAALRDEVQRSIPVLPFGVEMQDGDSGRVRDRASFELGLVEGREYTGLELAIEIGPDPGRDLIAAALGLGFLPQNCRITRQTNLSQASVGLSVLLALDHVERTGGAGRVELERLRRTAQAIASAIVGRQREDGSMAWVGTKTEDLRSTCQAVRFLALAKTRGLTGTDAALDSATEWLLKTLRTADAAARTDLVWALAACGKVRFESLNSLHRVRSSLSADSLARLALAFQRFGRGEAAGEVLAVLRQKLGPKDLPQVQGETVGLATAALLAADRRDPLGTRGLEYLLGSRIGSGWATAAMTAAAIRAITLAERTAAGAPRATKVTVVCNGATLQPEDAGSGVLTKRFVVPKDAVAVRGNKVEISVEGGGEVFYRAYLTGFGRGFLPTDRNDSRIRVSRLYLAPDRRHDGHEVPSGFRCIDGRGYSTFRNLITQLRVGESCRVRTTFSLRRTNDQRAMTPLIVEEPIPAGCSVPRDTVRGSFDHFELLAGRIVFFFRSGNSAGSVNYDLQARFPGTYRVPSTLVQSALRPEFRGYGEPGRLVIHPRGSDESDDYRLTPDELLYLGTKAFDAAGRTTGKKKTALFETSWGHLTKLLADWHKKEHHLRDRDFKEVARMMLFLGIERGDARTVVRFFEELKDRHPDLVIPFDRIVAVGKSYLDLGEFEAALLVFRATAEASFLKDAAVASVLQQHGEFRAANEFLANLLRTYPDLSTMRIARYSIGQKLAAMAASIAPDAPIDERTGSARELRARALEVLREFLVLYPEDPMADEVSFAWATTHVEGNDLEQALRVTEAAMQRYPDSSFADEFLYTSGYAHFALGQHDEAFAALRRVADEEFPRLGGGKGLSESKWHAVYLQGQIYHARGETSKALAAYDLVIERFGDAAEAADYFRRKLLTLPEVTTTPLAEKSKFELSYRNLEKVAVQVFKVDLMRLYVTERSLQDIRGIQLHGIQPQLSFEVELGNGRDYRTVKKQIELDLAEPGAYLVVLRSGDELASGMVLRSDLVIEAQEQFDAGRIRVNCKLGDAFLASAHVKIGSVGVRKMQSGSTDLRGVMAGDGLVGPATVIVQKDEQYAFYRGTGIHQPQSFAPPAAPQRAGPEQQERRKKVRFEAFENNLELNYGNRGRQIEWLEKNVLQKQQRGVEVYRTK